MLPETMARNDFRGLLAAVLVSGAGLSAGCAGSGTTVHDICFAPDASVVAYAHEDKLGFALSAESGYMRRAEYVRWGPPEKLLLPHSVKVAESEATGGPAGWEFDAVRRLRFSPDAKTLAIRTDKRVLALFLAGESVRRLHGPSRGRKGMAWRGPSELAWWEVTESDGPTGRTAELTVYRGRIGPGETPAVVHRETSPLGPTERYLYYRVSLAPGGRHAIFCRQGRGRAKVLDVADGTVVQFGPTGGRLEAVAWRPDGTAAFCQLAPPPGADGPAATAVLVACRSSASVRPVPEFADSKGPLNVLDAGWTAGGGYVLAEDGAGLVMVRPHPWKTWHLRDEAFTPPADATARAPQMGALPVPGWLWGRDGDDVYAIDYAQRHRIRIAAGPTWAISPDGTRVVESDRFGNLRLRRPKLPSLAPAGARGVSP